MTNAPPHGSPGAPLSYSNPHSGVMPRRSSYASVAAGNASQPSHLPSIQSTSAHLPRIVNTSSYTHHQGLDHQPSRIPQPVSGPETSGEGGMSIPESWGRGGDMSRYSAPRYSGSHLSNNSTGSPASLRPSYLKDSTYMEALEEDYKVKLAAQREEATVRPSNPGSLSTSSSSVSLQKMAPSHRGMTYEIIEHQPHPEIPYPAPLPSRWAETDKYGGLEIAADGLEVKYVGTHKIGEHDAAATRTDSPIPPQCGIYYFEVNIISRGKEGMIGVGFSGPTASLEKLPGWEPDSWAYHGDDGKTFGCHSQGKNYGPTFTSGDIVGCGINFTNGCGFFTKNGIFLGNAFRDLKINDPDFPKIYPSIGMKRPHAQLSVNLGQKPFVFDIDGLVSRERRDIQKEINDVDNSVLHPTLKKDDLCKALVAQYLSHDGYVETARAFAGEVRAEDTALRGRPEPKLESFLSMDEDHDATNRQRIRAAILEGDIDSALKLTHTFYPQVLLENSHIYFKLRCRKFVEMMRQSTEFLDVSPAKKPKSMNGHSTATSDDGFEPNMDVDEPMKDGDDWDRMDTEENENDRTDTSAKYESMLSLLVQYGQELKTEFKDDQSQLVTDTFTEIFSMFSYTDPRKSPHGKMLEPRQRISVAEGLNSAILVSLGKSSSTALERLYKQTSVLIDLISEDGGSGALINLRNILKASRSWQ